MQACWACGVAYVQADIDKPNHLPGVRSKLEPSSAILNPRKKAQVPEQQRQQWYSQTTVEVQYGPRKILKKDCRVLRCEDDSTFFRSLNSCLHGVLQGKRLPRSHRRYRVVWRAILLGVLRCLRSGRHGLSTSNHRHPPGALFTQQAASS